MTVKSTENRYTATNQTNRFAIMIAIPIVRIGKAGDTTLRKYSPMRTIASTIVATNSDPPPKISSWSTLAGALPVTYTVTGRRYTAFRRETRSRITRTSSAIGSRRSASRYRASLSNA